MAGLSEESKNNLNAVPPQLNSAGADCNTIPFFIFKSSNGCVEVDAQIAYNVKNNQDPNEEDWVIDRPATCNEGPEGEWHPFHTNPSRGLQTINSPYQNIEFYQNIYRNDDTCFQLDAGEQSFCPETRCSNCIPSRFSCVLQLFKSAELTNHIITKWQVFLLLSAEFMFCNRDG